ncbi:molybdate ABC transporter substrate-binding protein [Chromobacterium amazonense]|uniref:Molybdate ABC transporter substrate-binding protein n=1 Tax=Chromobacterium amazonense TaxID=1382803 RepID=A0ABU8UXW5_9NEIS|nr:molybdate ABC transporter substrate-binding protein [Chromobacterium amazonense]MBM2884027.1 molybdate ABC transporter substrate-binding protein [Chromobacterium amazonense]MDE1712193.1 molybdate ABC transporter substrate-binding protein [Chromobacterium amazonense]MDQ4541070.1 molybdate ABC transporter substrate-binding protein [Chromobacterium amazonense]
MSKILAACLLACALAIAHAAPVKVAAASNTEPALNEIVKKFTAKTGVTVKVAYGPPVALASQIANGAAYEIYISSNEEYTHKLQAQGRCLGEPRIFGLGSLVLWSLDADFHENGWLEWLRQGKGKIALPDPESSIYGQTVLYSLNHYQLAEPLRPRFVRAPDVAHAAALVASGKVAGAFVSKSQVLDRSRLGKGHWVEIPRDSYPPIRQTVALLTPAAGHPEARQLFDYLFSPESEKIWRAYGYAKP